ncbi:MAG: metallopeptidase family protein [Candidatus Saccharimonadales bacterium]
MKELSDEQFDALISRAMDELPQEYIRGLHNVAILMADEPDGYQREKSKLRHGHLLLGLFEGVPKIRQTGNESGLLPSKITLFKYPLLAITHDETSLFEQIKRTLWHEIAHYYGLDHEQINILQSR